MDSDTIAIPSIEQLLEPWRPQLGTAAAGYENHVRRVLALCEHLSLGAAEPDTRLAWTVAGAFHDLGIWSDGTWDYIEPSVALATRWLGDSGRTDLEPLVARMIREHHGLRARGPADDPVEIFRRADVIDVWLGIRRYGVPLSSYRRLMQLHADRGFHPTLIKLFAKNLVRRPLKPAPMFKW